MSTPRVVVWNEYLADHADRDPKKRDPEIFSHYPDGLHETIADGLRAYGIDTKTATLQQPEHGLTEDVLANTDVLIWWGHFGHALVSDEIIDRVQQAVLGGMGLIVLHSGHHSKLFRRLMGTSCNLAWREMEYGERVRLWTASPGHPIAQGLPPYFEIPHDEMYGEPFDIPQPDEQVFIGWYEGGEVFRSGCCFYRGKGRIFYLSAGHETFPVYHQQEVKQIIYNAALWAQPTVKERAHIINVHRVEPIEKVK